MQPSTKPSTSSPTITGSPTTVLLPDVVARASYIIAVDNSFSMSDYVSDLEASMDILAPQIAAGLNLTALTLGSGRRLAVVVDLPTSVDGVIIDSK